MAARRTKRDRIVDATLRLAEDQRWSEITLSAIADESRVSLAELRAEFRGKGAILAAFLDHIDAVMLENPDDGDADSDPRDRLFDVIMRRFDALAPYKTALRNILPDFSARPSAIVPGLERLIGTQRWMLEAAGARSPGVMGKIKTCGLAAVYLDVFRVWLREDDPGMPRTMARLDRLLRRGERALRRASGPISLGQSVCAVTRQAARKRRGREDAGAEDGIDGEPATP